MKTARLSLRRLRGLCPDSSEIRELGRPIALILAVAAIARFHDTIGLPPLEPDLLLRSLAIGWAALLFTTFGHELGHAIVGSVLGFCLHEVRVGPLAVTNLERGIFQIRVKFDMGRALGGSVSLELPLHLSDDEAARRYRKVLQAGALGSAAASLALAMAAALDFIAQPYDQIAVLLACARACIYQWGYARAHPTHNAGTDGGMLFALQSDAKSFLAQRRANAVARALVQQLLSGTIALDWDSDRVNRARPLMRLGCDPHEDAFVPSYLIAWSLFWYDLDRDDDESAWKCGSTLAALVEIGRTGNVDIHPMIANVAALISASIQGDRERVRRLEPSPEHPDDPRDNVLQKMTDATLLLMEGNLDRTSTELRAVRDELLALDRLDIGDRGLLRMIDQMEEHIRSGPTGEPWAARFLPAAIKSAA